MNDELLAKEMNREGIETALRLQSALLEIRDHEAEEQEEFFHLVTEKAAEALVVERLSIWLFNDSREDLVCRDLFLHSQARHEIGLSLAVDRYPVYFQAIGTRENLAADDAMTHPATSEFAKSYLQPFGIASMLDVPIRQGRTLIGVICCEHTGPARRWRKDEQEFLGSVAESILLSLENARRRKAELEIRRLNHSLELLVAERTRELRESEERARSIIESVKDYAIFMLDVEGRVVTWNAGAERIKGYRAEEIVGRSYAVFYPAEEVAAGKPENDLKLAQLAGAKEEESWRMRKDGSRFWASSTVTAVYDEFGRLRGFSKVIRDMTERRQAEENMRIAAERLQLATGAGRIGIWDWNVEEDVMTWNEQMLAMYGFSPGEAEMEAARWIDCIHPDDREGTVALLRRSLRDGAYSFATEFRIVQERTVAERSIRAHATIFRNAEGKAQRVIGTSFDVTDERVREQALADALEKQKALTRSAQAGEKAKSEFLAMMSHEIRTPMNGILGFADILSQSPTLSGEEKKIAETIHSSGQALLRILNDVLDFSRIGAGQLMTVQEDYSPRELIAGMEALFADQTMARGLAFRVFVGENIPDRALGDADRIRQILVNLIGNALKFTDRGEIMLEAACEMNEEGGGVLEFVISDTGQGIPEHQIESIFDPFQQADSTLTRRHGGTGLGLAISRRLSELMGGELRVTSRVGEGSRFTLNIPFAARTGHDQEACLVPHFVLDGAFAQTHPLRILVVEDDVVNLKLIVLVTRKLGYEPLTACNGREAIECFRRESPSCILMDIQMPEMDGIEAAKIIRAIEAQRGSRPCFISALTANTVPADRERSLEVGMDAYLNKPLRSSEYVRVLEKASRQVSGNK